VDHGHGSSGMGSWGLGDSVLHVWDTKQDRGRARGIA
jgi:hypothetical protein